MNNRMICPKCGEVNELGRSYCWVCYQKFETPTERKSTEDSSKQSTFQDHATAIAKAIFMTFIVIGGLCALSFALMFITCIGAFRRPW